MVPFAVQPDQSGHSMPDPLVIAKCPSELALLPAMANRHGLTAGATGTGKTVTLQVIAEQLSRIDVPVLGLPGSASNRNGCGREGIVEAAAKSAVRAISSQLGRQIIRGA